MKKSKLLVLSLLAVSAIGLTSCGEAGPKGDTGDQGAPGEKGETGAPGKDGVDGKDGTNFLNGEGEPLSSLGKDGDSYLDTLTYDYYVKVSGAWVKKGNIKGEKGEDGATGEKGETGSKGEKGDTGSQGATGPQGNKGDTAWSNLILSSQYATITPDKGSYKENTTATFTVEFADNLDGYEAFSLLVTNGSETKDLVLKEKVGTKYVYTATIPAGGYVVQADFGSFTSAINKRSNILLVGNVKLNDKVTITKETKIDFNGHSIDVNGKTIEDQSLLELQNSGTKSADNGEIYDGTNGGENTLLSVNGTKVATEVKNQYSEKNDANAISAFGLDNELERYAEDEESSGKASLTVGKNVSIIANGKGAAIASTGTDSHITIQEDAVVKNTNTTEGKAIEVGGVGEVKIEGKVSSDGGTAVAVTESAAIDKDNKAAVTISGSVASGSGTAVEVASASKVTVSGGSVTSTSGTAVSVTETAVKGEEKASVVIETKDDKKAEVSSTSGTAVEVKAGEVKVEKDTTVSGGTSAITVSNGSVMVSGVVTGGSTSAVEVSGGSVTVAETGTVTAKEKDQETTTPSAIKVTGGDVTISGTVSGSDNVVDVSNGSVKVEGTQAAVTASEGTAVKQSGDASLTVSSGTVSGTTSAVTVEGGTVNISGGTVQTEAKGDASSKEAAAIKIEKSADSAISVNVSGGTVQNLDKEGKVNTDSDVIKESGESGTSSVVIDGSAKVESTKKYNVSIKNDITDGTVAFDGNIVTDGKVESGKSVSVKFTPSDGKALSTVTVNGNQVYDKVTFDSNGVGTLVCSIVSDVTVGATFVDKDKANSKDVIVDTATNKTYDDFKSAREAEGSKNLKLLKDLTVSLNYGVQKEINLNLNGKTINCTNENGYGFGFTVFNGGTLNLTGEGKVVGNFANENGKTYSMINVYNSSSSVKNVLNIGENVELDVKTIDGVSACAVAVFAGNQKTLSEINVNGKINVSSGIGVTVNGLVKSLEYEAKDNVVNIGEKAEITATKGVAIYQAGLSTFNIKGGKFSGSETAMEVRAGDTNIEGGSFTSTAQEFECDKNGGGTTTSGAALAVVQHVTDQVINVTVTGGTFSGIKGLYAADIENVTATEDIHIVLNGGIFTSTEEDGDAIDIQNGIECSTNFTDAATLGDIYFAGGEGTEENPYLIETKEQLLSTYIYKDKLKHEGSRLYYKLENDIDLTSIAAQSFETVWLENAELDLNKKTITSLNGGVAYDGHNAVIKNGKFVAEDEGSYALFVGNESYNTKVDGNKVVNPAQNIVLDNVSCDGGINVCDACVTIKNSDIVGDAEVSGKKYYAVWAESGATVIIESGTYKSKSGMVVRNDDNTVGNITIKGGTFYGEIIKKNSPITIEGGTFDQDPTAHGATVDATKYDVKITGSDEEGYTYTVVAKNGN